jgi:hypothetical protein
MQITRSTSQGYRGKQTHDKARERQRGVEIAEGDWCQQQRAAEEPQREPGNEITAARYLAFGCGALRVLRAGACHAQPPLGRRRQGFVNGPGETSGWS